MHPYFVRGNKTLCSSMSRHHLPNSEMYSQAISRVTNHNDTARDNELHEIPQQLIIDRRIESVEWNRKPELMGAIESTDSCCRRIARKELVSEREKSANKILSFLDQEEDWSLLSDCIDYVVHRDTAPPSSTTEESLLSKISKHRFVPVEALAPGMEEPASPQMVERLFAELSRI